MCTYAAITFECSLCKTTLSSQPSSTQLYCTLYITSRPCPDRQNNAIPIIQLDNETMVCDGCYARSRLTRLVRYVRREQR